MSFLSGNQQAKLTEPNINYSIVSGSGTIFFGSMNEVSGILGNFFI
jgi:hypothetical protein